MSHVAPQVIAEMQSRSSFSWRIDTHIEEGDSVSDDKGFREMIIRWAKGQQYIVDEGYDLSPHLSSLLVLVVLIPTQRYAPTTAGQD